MYQAFYSYNSNASWTWQYEIDANGDGTWIDIAAHPQKEALGYFPDGTQLASLLLQKKNQTVDFPNALMRFRLTGSLNDYDSELSTEAVPAWADTFEQYDPPKYASGLEGILDAYATKEYTNQVALRSITQRKLRPTGQTRFTALAPGSCKPAMQEVIQFWCSAHPDRRSVSKTLRNLPRHQRYISVHALGGGDFMSYQFEKAGDTLRYMATR